MHLIKGSPHSPHSPTLTHRTSAQIFTSVGHSTNPNQSKSPPPKVSTKTRRDLSCVARNSRSTAPRSLRGEIDAESQVILVGASLVFMGWPTTGLLRCLKLDAASEAQEKRILGLGAEAVISMRFCAGGSDSAEQNTSTQQRQSFLVCFFSPRTITS